MNFTHLQWANAEHTQIHATLESGDVILVNGPGLLHYDAIVASGTPIAPYEPAATPEQQVLYEHENRILALEGQPPITAEDFLQKVRSLTT